MYEGSSPFGPMYHVGGKLRALIQNRRHRGACDYCLKSTNPEIQNPELPYQWAVWISMYGNSFNY